MYRDVLDKHEATIKDYVSKKDREKIERIMYYYGINYQQAL